MYVGSTFPHLKERYIDTGKIYYVFKDFPILSSHPQAGLAAQAAECAGEQGSYWQMHDKLFAQPDEWDRTRDRALNAFRRYAEVVGVDPEQLDQCVREGRHAREVQADFDEARRLGLSATPAFIINGKLMSGAQPTEVFVQILDQELNGR